MNPADEEREKMRRWVQNWQTVGPILEQMRADDLAAMSDADSVAAFNALDGDPALSWRSPESANGAGMIEQQRFFAKGHRRERDL